MDRLSEGAKGICHNAESMAKLKEALVNIHQVASESETIESVGANGEDVLRQG